MLRLNVSAISLSELVVKALMHDENPDHPRTTFQQLSVGHVKNAVSYFPKYSPACASVTPAASFHHYQPLTISGAAPMPSDIAALIANRRLLFR